MSIKLFFLFLIFLFYLFNLCYKGAAAWGNLFPFEGKVTKNNRDFQISRKNFLSGLEKFLSCYYIRPCQLGRKLRHNLFFWYFLSKLHHSSYISDFISLLEPSALRWQLSDGKFTNNYREYHIFYI